MYKSMYQVCASSEELKLKIETLWERCRFSCVSERSMVVDGCFRKPYGSKTENAHVCRCVLVNFVRQKTADDHWQSLRPVCAKSTYNEVNEYGGHRWRKMLFISEAALNIIFDIWLVVERDGFKGWVSVIEAERSTGLVEEVIALLL